MRAVKSSRAVHHLEQLAETCTKMADMPSDIYRIRVRQLWTFAEMLEPAHESGVDSGQRSAIDLPVGEVAWRARAGRRRAQRRGSRRRSNRNPLTSR